MLTFRESVAVAAAAVLQQTKGWTRLSQITRKEEVQAAGTRTL